jgi:hypothetical protein
MKLEYEFCKPVDNIKVQTFRTKQDLQSTIHPIVHRMGEVSAIKSEISDTLGGNVVKFKKYYFCKRKTGVSQGVITMQAQVRFQNYKLNTWLEHTVGAGLRV